VGRRLRPVRGVRPAVAGAAAAGFRKVAVPGASVPEAALVPGLAVLGAPTLGALLAWLRGEGETGQEVTVVISGEGAGVEPARAGGRTAAPGRPGAAGRLHPHDQADGGPGGEGRPDLPAVLGQPAARRAAEICAAGGHHLSLLGPPGVGNPSHIMEYMSPSDLPGYESEWADIGYTRISDDRTGTAASPAR